MLVNYAGITQAYRIKQNTIKIQLRYKIFHGHMDVDLSDNMLVNARLTRGYDLKFIQPPVNIDAHKYNFFPDVIRL